MSVERFKAETFKVFSNFRHCEFIVSKIMQFVCQTPEQTHVDINRFETLMEFAKVCPFHTRRLKQSSPGMDGIMANEY